jgi:hypothetical protein
MEVKCSILFLFEIQSVNWIQRSAEFWIFNVNNCPTKCDYVQFITFL